MYLTGQRKKYISFLIVGIMVFVTLTGAVLSAPVCVYALSLSGLRGTIASLIISLLLQTGVAPTNQSWLNQLNNAYGVESSIGTIEDMISNGLLTESGGSLIDTGLSQAIQNESAWNDLGLDDIFSTTVNDSGVLAGSGAVNLANQAINLGTGGTIGAFAGAAVIGVGIGVLANHVRDYVSTIVKFGFPLSLKEKQNILNNIPTGYDKAYYVIRQNGNKEYINIAFVNNTTNCSAYYYNNYGGFTSMYYNNNNVDNSTKLINQYTNSTLDTNSTTTSSGGFSYTGNNNNGNILVATNINPIFQTQTDMNNYINAYKNGGNNGSGLTHSPDLIGTDGNLTYNYDDNEPNNIGNIVPDGHDMYPVDMDDYQDFVDQANDNTENGDITSEQGQTINDFVDPYFVDTSNQPIIPDNPNEVPTYPERPVVPDQPTIPDKTDVTNEDIQQSLEGATTIDLRSVFPFCIPWDIYNLILIFDTGEDREAPHITFTFPFNENWVVDVDLAEYNSVAAILRLLELIVFIVGLMVATRSLIGAKG